MYLANCEFSNANWILRLYYCSDLIKEKLCKVSKKGKAKKRFLIKKDKWNIHHNLCLYSRAYRELSEWGRFDELNNSLVGKTMYHF